MCGNIIDLTLEDIKLARAKEDKYRLKGILNQMTATVMVEVEFVMKMSLSRRLRRMNRSNVLLNDKGWASSLLPVRSELFVS